jgi:hypothetical protein
LLLFKAYDLQLPALPKGVGGVLVLYIDVQLSGVYQTVSHADPFHIQLPTLFNIHPFKFT